jgi:hypothetical protein
MILQWFGKSHVDMNASRWHSIEVRFVSSLLFLGLLLSACSSSEHDSVAHIESTPDQDAGDRQSDSQFGDVGSADGSPPTDLNADSADALPLEPDVWPDVDSTVPEESVALTDNEEWTKTLSANDPWWGEDSAEELCEPTDYGPETTPIGMLFDIDTSFCGYLTVDQTLLAEVPIGDLLRVKIVQYALTESEGPYLLAVAIGEPAVTVWEMTIEVPADFQVVDVTWPAARTYLIDEPVYFHLSNHGENTWSFVNLTRESAPQ